MARLKKNIWLIFIIISAICTLSFISYSIQEWKQIKRDYAQMQSTRTALFAHSTGSFFAQISATFDLLGRYLLQAEHSDHDEYYSELIDQLIDTNRSIKAMVIMNMDGSTFAASSNFDLNARARNRTKPEEVYLNNVLPDQTILNRSHISHISHEFVIPFGRFIQDAPNDVMPRILVTGGILFNSMPLFKESTQGDSALSFEIIRWDGYLQYSARSIFDYYNKPIPRDYFDQITSIHDGKQSAVQGSTGTHLGIVYKDDKAYEAAVAFNPHLQSWFVATVPVDTIKQTFIKKHTQITLEYFAFIIIFFFLSRYIEKSELKRTQILRNQLERDHTTRLPNRTYLRNHMEKWLEKHKSATLFYMDIDKFKDINEGLGYSVGDRVLYKIGKRLKRFSPDGALLAREFSNRFVLLVEDSDDFNPNIYAKGLHTLLCSPYKVHGTKATLTASIGMIRYPQDGTDFSEMMISADIAMSNAKQSRNAIATLTPEMVTAYRSRIQIGKRLRAAIKENIPSMVFQPQVGRDGKVKSLEALVRWTDSELGFIPPDRFIGVAEVTGQMVALGRLIINKSIADFARIQESTSTPLKLSINASIQQLTDTSFVPDLVHTLDKHGVRSTDITVEVTESIFIDDIRRVRATCMQLEFYGIRLSLDDFGTGYSSLSVLRKLRISELKIDRAFITAITKNRKALTLLKNILKIAQDLRMTTVVEGVETQEQRNILFENNCDLFQGYYYAKPMPVYDVIDYINQHNHSSINAAKQ